MFLTNEGSKMQNEHTRFDIKDSTFACQTIYDALKKVLGITRSKSLDPDGFKNSTTTLIKSKTKKEQDLSDDGTHSYAGVSDFDIKDLMDTEDALLANIQLLVNSCWDDGKALSILADNITNLERNIPGAVNQIWAIYPDKAKEILLKKLKGVYKEAKESLAVMDTIMAKRIKENMKYLKALENGESVNFDKLDFKEQQVINKLSSSGADNGSGKSKSSANL